MNLQVIIECYNDLDLLAGALDSLPNEIDTYVFDGRYASFEGELDYTPGAREVVEKYDNTYFERPEEQLPWGHDAELHPKYRASKHAQMEYILGTIPNDTWTLKLDSDERLRKFDVGLTELDKEKVYHITALVDETPYSTMPDGELYVPRLFYPKNWSFWVDDVPLPRDEIPRDAPIEEKFAFKDQGKHLQYQNIQHKQKVIVTNIGHKRPKDYKQSRKRELEQMYAHKDNIRIQ